LFLCVVSRLLWCNRPAAQTCFFMHVVFLVGVCATPNSL
jgi:hypothetical protein